MFGRVFDHSVLLTRGRLATRRWYLGYGVRALTTADENMRKILLAQLALVQIFLAVGIGAVL